MKKILSVVMPSVVFVAICAAQQATMSEVLRGDLSAPGREVVQNYIVLPPGAGSGGRHTHPGEEIVFVIEGTTRIEVDDDTPVLRNAGESFMAPAGRVHYAANAGSGTARAVATYIVEKGRPRTTFAQ
jgi:quercetin dioxygenase-like cupin family protein